MVTSAGGVELAFDEHGYLPKGRHQVTVDQVEALLVTGLPDDGTRRRLLDSWLVLRQALASLGVPVVGEWLNGSFATNRVQPPPGDIDLVVVIDHAAFEQLPVGARAAVVPLLDGPNTRARFGIDAYVLPHFDLGHPERSRALKQQNYWDDKWGRARKDEHGTRRRKGYLEVTP